MESAPSATSSAPTMPSAIPPSTNRPRIGTPRVAAHTTEMMSAASSTSRKTNNATPGTCLLHDQPALRRVAMKITEKSVHARVQRSDIDDDAVLRQHHGLTVEIGALEFLGRVILIRHADLEFGVG